MRFVPILTVAVAAFFALLYAYEIGRSTQRQIEIENNKTLYRTDQSGKENISSSRAGAKKDASSVDANTQRQETSKISTLLKFLPLGEAGLVIATLLLASATLQLVIDGRENSWRQLRAYVSVEPRGINRYGIGTDFLGHVGIRNQGRVAARKVSYVIHIVWKADGHWTTRGLDPIVQRDVVLQPGTEMKLGSPFAARSMNESTSHPSYLYVFGRIEYQDGLREQTRFTNFCHRYNCEVIEFDNKHLLPSDNGRYHENHNNAD